MSCWENLNYDIVLIIVVKYNNVYVSLPPTLNGCQGIFYNRIRKGILEGNRKKLVEYFDLLA